MNKHLLTLTTQPHIAAAPRPLALSLTRLAAAGAMAACAVGAAVSAASAHAVLTPAQAQADSTWRGAVRIGHGCEGTATRLVRVTIPDGVVAVRPRAKNGWLIETTWAPYAKPVEIHGKKVSEGVKTITWKGAALADHMFDDFEFMVRITPDVAPQNGKLYFPVYQECEKGAFDWADIPASDAAAQTSGATASKTPASRTPAPALTLTATTAAAAPAAKPASTTAGATAGALAVTGGWTRATPAGARVAGAYVQVNNATARADVLLGGRFDVADKVEVHDMTMTDGVMRMRKLDPGLDVPAGGKVELRPGGLHLMLMGLKRQLKQGEVISGVLSFRDAGEVEVALPVEAAGAPGPGKGAGAPEAGHTGATGHGDHQH